LIHGSKKFSNGLHAITILCWFWSKNKFSKIFYFFTLKASLWKDYLFGWMSHLVYVISHVIFLQAKRYVLILIKSLIILTCLKFCFFEIFRRFRGRNITKFPFVGQYMYLTLENTVIKSFQNSNFSDFLEIKSEINQTVNCKSTVIHINTTRIEIVLIPR